MRAKGCWDIVGVEMGMCKGFGGHMIAVAKRDDVGRWWHFVNLVVMRLKALGMVDGRACSGKDRDRRWSCKTHDTVARMN